MEDSQTINNIIIKIDKDEETDQKDDKITDIAEMKKPILWFSYSSVKKQKKKLWYQIKKTAKIGNKKREKNEGMYKQDSNLKSYS